LCRFNYFCSFRSN